MNGLDCPTGCPFIAPRDVALDFPVGMVRAVASTQEPGPGEVDETKRNVLKLLAVAGVVAAGAGGAIGGALQYARPPVVGLSSYPKTQLIDVNGSALTVDRVMKEYSLTTAGAIFIFNYPLQNEPNFFLNLNPTTLPVLGGIGGPNQVTDPTKSQGPIVAFSAICQHLGCVPPAIAYYPPGTCPAFTPSGKNGAMKFYIHCSCHGSTYDVTSNANPLTGPTLYALPQVLLETDADGNIYAHGMASLDGVPINGHIHNLQGGYGVGNSQQLYKDTPTILCP